MNVYGDVQAMSQYGDAAEKPPLYGIYNVESVIRNRDSVPPLATDTTRWKKMIISYSGSARVVLMNDSSRRYNFVIDTAMHTIVMNTYADTAIKARYTYSRPVKDELLLKGVFKNDSLTIRFKKYDLNNFILLKRGFHWVNEYPYNR